jgi:hypothetical protein
MMNTNTTSQAVTSPFDPFLARFLVAVQAIETGFSPTANSKGIADLLDVDPAFVEMLTTSARRRRFIEAFYAPAHRNTLRWRVSPRGEEYLASHPLPPLPGIEELEI